MTLLEMLLSIAIILLLFIVFYLLLKGRKSTPDLVEETMVDLLKNIQEEVQKSNTKDVNNRLDTVLQQINQHQEQATNHFLHQQDKNQHLVNNISQQLTHITGTNEQILGFAKQMKSLERILQNPKQRGIFGEYVLEKVLANVLTINQYTLQYKFTNGEKVDAAIFFKDKIIPVDAKFSLDKYNKLVQETDSKRQRSLAKAFRTDVKNRIDETAKYIRPKENTTDFAFMFIPAEGVYYHLLAFEGTQDTHNLVEYAFAKKVMLVSPMAFYAYLATILQGLKALQIEDSIKEVTKKIRQLEQHLQKYATYVEKTEKHLTTTVNSFNRMNQEFAKIDKDIFNLNKESY